MKNRPLVAAMLAAVAGMVLLALAACSPQSPPRVDDVIMTTTVDRDARPLASTNVFKAGGGKVIASVRVSNLVVGSRVATRWYYGTQEVVSAASSLTADRSGSGYYAFSMSSSTPFPAGNWKVEILLDDLSVDSAEFQVVP